MNRLHTPTDLMVVVQLGSASGERHGGATVGTRWS